MEIELVAEVRRVLRQHAVAEEAEDGRVLLPQLELELRLVLVELIEVAHLEQCSPAPRGSSRAPGAARARTAVRADGGAAPAGPARRSPRRRRAKRRGRASSARRSGLRAFVRNRPRSGAAGSTARARRATSRARRHR